MEHIVSNLKSKITRQTFNGRSYLVAPLVLLPRPGVLHGSKGRLFYPADEVSKDYEQWNGVPLVIEHPTFNGFSVSARDPEILEKQQVGHVFRVKVNGKLSGEAWFDEELTKNHDKNLPAEHQMIPRLEQGLPIEISTGLFTDNEPAPEGSQYKGQAYDYIARNHRPDHLAILPSKTGACSIKDGCGILVNGAAKGTSMDVWHKLGEFIGSVVNTKDGGTPSEELDMDAEKACLIVKDGSAHGKPLTEAQRGMFGALCGQRKTENEKSFADVQMELNSLLANQHQSSNPNGIPGGPWVVDVFDDHIVYSQDGKYYRLGYTTENEKVLLNSGPPQEVTRTTAYIPTSNANPSQPRDDSGRFDKVDRVEMRSAIRRGFKSLLIEEAAPEDKAADLGHSVKTMLEREAGTAEEGEGQGEEGEGDAEGQVAASAATANEHDPETCMYCQGLI